MISQTVEYALRAVVTIAQHDGHACTARQISEITQVRAPYLSKLMQRLARSGIVRSQRGLHGGFVLAHDPGELTIWDVVDAVEPFQRIHDCPLGIESHSATLCPLHRRLDRAMEMVEEMFRGTTIANLLAEPGAVTPLCQEKKMILIEANVQAMKGQTTGKPKNTDKKT
jgi:Rrf2 family nitric oxide-sensitive transcriptional repressor